MSLSQHKFTSHSSITHTSSDKAGFKCDHTDINQCQTCQPHTRRVFLLWGVGGGEEWFHGWKNLIPTRYFPYSCSWPPRTMRYHKTQLAWRLKKCDVWHLHCPTNHTTKIGRMMSFNVNLFLFSPSELRTTTWLEERLARGTVSSRKPLKPPLDKPASQRPSFLFDRFTAKAGYHTK